MQDYHWTLGACNYLVSFALWEAAGRYQHTTDINLLVVLCGAAIFTMGVGMYRWILALKRMAILNSTPSTRSGQ